MGSAMKAATDNAEELAAALLIVFNKKRQAAITQEICEISAAALALEGGDKTLLWVSSTTRRPSRMTSQKSSRMRASQTSRMHRILVNDPSTPSRSSQRR